MKIDPLGIDDRPRVECENKKKVNNELKLYNLNKTPNDFGKTIGRIGLEGKLAAQFWTFQFDSLVRHLSGEIL